ncbi:MAG: DUF3035 domain-containing protein [Rubellimicrobium sp.]|nr:DUF3035 domain-containing protein [Rubellimicrobium sp.]
MTARPLIPALCLVVLAACGGGRGLHDLDRTSWGPDEFSVLPALPLEIPPVLGLPPPTPGGVNRTDRNPVAEGVAALGGTQRAPGAGVPAADTALVAHAGRNGTDPAIRTTLASEDAAIRRGAGQGARGLFGGDRYFPAYAFMALDAYAEMARFRALGVRVPTAPPGN